jgi:hypothetical protein
VKLPLLILAVVLSAPLAFPAESSATGDVAAAANPVAPLTRDLGRNLAYHRVRTLPADLPDESRKQPCVVDLRYVRADHDAAADFQRWVKARASVRTPVFILANADTDRDLVAPLTGRSGAANVVVIGAPSRSFNPDIAVEISAADERRAYDALADGIELSALLTENPNKVRNDEASLSRDRSTLPEIAGDSATARDQPTAPIDAALQRAVHLHRTLVALRKI